MPSLFRTFLACKGNESGDLSQVWYGVEDLLALSPDGKDQGPGLGEVSKINFKLQIVD